MTGPARSCCSSRTARGTRRGVVTEAVAEQARGLLGVPVAVCYVDVRHPTPADALAELPGRWWRCRCSSRRATTCGWTCPRSSPPPAAATCAVAETFGPDPALVAAAASRLRAAGLRERDAVVLAVIGSTDPHARADGATAAPPAGAGAARPVTLATIAMGGPRVPDAVARLRADGRERRMAVARWLLAPGLFQRALAASGADVVAEPLATHEAVARLVAARYTAALANRTSVA